MCEAPLHLEILVRDKVRVTIHFENKVESQMWAMQM